MEEHQRKPGLGDRHEVLVSTKLSDDSEPRRHYEGHWQEEADNSNPTTKGMALGSMAVSSQCGGGVDGYKV